MPINANQVMTKITEKIKEAKAESKNQFMMADEGLWGADWYIEVSKKVPGLEMARISGTFLTKAFEGNYNEMGNWIREMQEFVAKKKKKLKKLYFFYTMCPACAKAYGQNYTVILAQV